MHPHPASQELEYLDLGFGAALRCYIRRWRLWIWSSGMSSSCSVRLPRCEQGHSRGCAKCWLNQWWHDNHDSCYNEIPCWLMLIVVVGDDFSGFWMILKSSQHTVRHCRSRRNDQVDASCAFTPSRRRLTHFKVSGPCIISRFQRTWNQFIFDPFSAADLHP